VCRAWPPLPTFTSAEDPPKQTRGVIAVMRMADEPLRHDGACSFGASDLFTRSFAQGRAQFFGEGYARTGSARRCPDRSERLGAGLNARPRCSAGRSTRRRPT